MTSKKRLYDLSPCKHFTRAWNSISSALRRNRNPLDRVPGDRRGHETGGLDVPGEIAEVFRAGRPPLRRAHRLLHGGKTAFQHARSRELGGVGRKARLQAREHFELVLHENLVRSVDPLHPDELRMLEIAAEVEVVGALRRHGDAHALAVHFRHRADRRARRDEVSRLDLEIRRAEGDFARALRLVAEEGDVPGAGLYRVGELSGCLEGDQIDRNVQPPAELPPQVHRDTAEFAARRVLVHQQEISVVDADAQLPRRGQLRARGGGRRHGAGGATETPRTACLSIALATNTEAFASSANSRRYFAPAARPCVVPIDCCTAEKRPSSTREPGSFSASVTRRGFNPASTSSLSLTKSS